MIWKLLLLCTWIGIAYGYYKHTKYITATDQLISEQTQEIKKKDELLLKVNDSIHSIEKLQKEWKQDLAKCG